jgi:Fe-S cluster assembly protein SufD
MKKYRINKQQQIELIWTGKETTLSYDITLTKKNASVTLLCLLFGKSNQKLSLTITVTHPFPQTKSTLLIKSMLTDYAEVTINAKIQIQNTAARAETQFISNTLLLSDHALGKTTPSLEILENDVLAGHKVTVGQLNEQEIFYLMSRGLSRSQAKQLLIQGFFSNIITRLSQKNKQKVIKQLAV